MASELGQPPPAKCPPTAPTTITDISDDLLCEIFLLLPSLPSLVRAALACRTFLHAVRSSPAFRRRFRALHRPQLLGFFRETGREAIPPFVPIRRSSDPDLTAAVSGSDFFLFRLPEDSDSTPGWELRRCHDGYLVLANNVTDQIAAYNPLTQALHLFPTPLREILSKGLFPQPQRPKEIRIEVLEFHILFSEEDQRVFRMACVQFRNISKVPVCVAVFSPATREWQVLPWPAPPQPVDDDWFGFCPGMQMSGFVYWKHKSKAYLLVLDNVTLQFSRVYLPHFLRKIDPTLFKLGQTKDGKLCMVCADDSDANIGTLVVHVWGADDDGVEKWMLEDTFPLSTFIDADKYLTEDDTTVQIEAVIDGFVYLSIKYDDYTESLISFCLETAELNTLFDDTYASPAYPYIMSWPPSLEDSQTKITGCSVEDAGSVGTEETPSALVTAPQSHKFA
uniref:F-box protein AT5G49610-like beta-propeller domain-containing protein n=1 Tax=Aegilops tauschii TaxID=37682 RepID=M8BTJ3_AEGTA